MAQIEILIITHYAKDDPQFVYDYCDIEIFVDGKLVKEYGDYYHDNGKEKVEGFIDAYKDIYGKDTIFVLERDVADRGI